MDSKELLTRAAFLMTTTLVAATPLIGACGAPTSASEPTPSHAQTAQVVPVAAPTVGELTEAAVKNGRYQLPDLGAVQLKDGRYDEKYGEGATQVNRVVYQTAAFGDLDRDGVRDAAVVLWSSGGGSGTFGSLVALANKGGALQQVAVEELGDRTQVKSLAITEGKIVVDLVTFGPNDPRCCPSQAETRSYRLEGGALKLVPGS